MIILNENNNDTLFYFGEYWAISTIYHHHHMALQPNMGPGLSFWGFVTITFLQGWIVSPVPNPQPGGPGLHIYDPSYTPRHWVPILVAFYNMYGLQWDYSLIPATTQENLFIQNPELRLAVAECFMFCFFLNVIL
jgi:hypothetical protein